MSGPKTVNIRIHNQGLNSIVSTQSEIRTLVHFIECFAIHDSERKFHYEGSSILGTLRVEIQACLRSVELPTQTELSFSQSGALGNAIRDKQQALEKMKKVLKELKQRCEACQKDYIHSVSTQSELQSCLHHRCEYLKNLIAGIETHLEKQDTISDITAVKNRLQQIPMTADLPEFCLDLHSRKAKLMDKLLSFFKEQEDKVFSIHAQFCSDLNMSTIRKSGLKKHATPAQQQILSEINELLNQLPEGTAKDKIYSELEYYKNAPDYCTDTSYKHLKSTLQGILASNERRNELLLIAQKLSGLPQNDPCTKLAKLVQAEISNDLIPESTFMKLCQAWEALEAENTKKQLEQYAKEQESRYIKEKLVKALGDLNYTVVSNAKGLQDSQNSFVFKVPHQDNYIYVEYLKGKFLYNFLVPEKVAELSREDLRRKVSEMGSACEGFLQAMKNLQAYGMNFNYTHKEASENHVISIPEAIRKTMDLEALQHEKQRQHTHEQKRMTNDQ
ncbi:MAG: hypothetical protein KA984_03430 [Candidatus Cloacimonetes bacterium]|nr:hypothetical protein [Candidatus Cloacimonadota bacterium]